MNSMRAAARLALIALALSIVGCETPQDKAPSKSQSGKNALRLSIDEVSLIKNLHGQPPQLVADGIAEIARTRSSNGDRKDIAYRVARGLDQHLTINCSDVCQILEREKEQ